MQLKNLLRALSLVLASVVATLACAVEITWIDVRTPDEFNQQHVEGAVNIFYEDIDAGVDRLGLEKDSVIYLYCRTGRKAGIAKESLEALGYTAVVNIGGLEAALVQAEEITP